MERVTIEELAAEYERGKRHGKDDRKMIEAHCREQQREIHRLKTELLNIHLERAHYRKSGGVRT